MRSLFVAILALTSICVSSISNAQAPDPLSFQGYVTDPGGVPIDNAGISMTFKLYEGASEIWSETQPSVAVVAGVFNVLLGSVVPLDSVRFNRDLSLGIKVGGDPEISPRTQLAAAAYAKAMPGLYAFYRRNGNFNRSYNVIGGGANNVVGADVTGATIGGGGGIEDGDDRPNQVLSDFTTVSGGYDNIADAGLATISGGARNNASGSSSVVGGGGSNTASGLSATIGGGGSNTASGPYATVPGGSGNRATKGYTFAAGRKAWAIHSGSFVWGDSSGSTFTSTGVDQFIIRAAGGVAIGSAAPHTQLTVAGDTDVLGRLVIGDPNPRAMLTLRGGDNSLTGPMMFMYGDAADQVESGRIRFVEGTSSTNFRGAYIRYDGNNTTGNRLHIGIHNAGTNTTADDTDIITIERNGGDLGIKRNNPSHPLHVGTGTSNGNGAHVTDSGIWTDASSRTFKMDFADLDKVGLLEQVAQLPVSEWSYKGHEGERHIGPFAEDFFQTFGLGSDDMYIGGSDASGVALAAIQGLYELVQEQQELLAGIQAENEQMRAVMDRAGLR